MPRHLPPAVLVQRVAAAFIAVLVIIGFWESRDTMMLGFAAAVLAVGISIPAGWLQRRGLPHGWAVAISALAVGVASAALVLFVLPRLLADLAALIAGLPTALESLGDVYENMRASDGFWSDALPALDDGDGGRRLTAERARVLLDQVVKSSLAVAPVVLGGVSTLVAALVHFGIVVFVALFVVVDPTAYVRGSLYLLPERHHVRAVEVWNALYETVRTWLTALSISITITVVLVWVVLGLILGMPNALVVAVFAGIATFIPNIGAFLPLIPIVVFTLASGDPSDVLLYVPVYLGIQLLESNVLTPSIVKSQLAIPAGVVLLFQLVVALAFGALGLLLAVPLLACLIVLVRELYSYDVLGLRRLDIALATDAAGRLVLDERPKSLPAPAPTPPATIPPATTDGAPHGPTTTTRVERTSEDS